MKKLHLISLATITLMSSAHQAIANSENKAINKGTGSIYQGYYTLELSRGPYEACIEFKKTGIPYTKFLDQTLEENFQKFESMYIEKMNAIAECYKMPIEEQNVLKERAKNNYKDSDNARTYRMGVAMVIAGHENAEKFVNGCNTFSQSYSLLYSQSKDEKIDPLTCESKN